jgi:hypothetical protein
LDQFEGPENDFGSGPKPFKSRRKIVVGDAVKPFGNSQKGKGNGPLTWITAWDKLPP